MNSLLTSVQTVENEYCYAEIFLQGFYSCEDFQGWFFRTEESILKIHHKNIVSISWFELNCILTSTKPICRGYLLL